MTTLKTVEEVTKTMPTYNCSNCNGDGYDVVPSMPHGEPEQIQCRECHAEGKYTTLDCVRTVITQDRQASADVLCALLEGERATVEFKKTRYGSSECVVCSGDEDSCGCERYNQAIKKAQDIIREALSSKDL